MACKRADRGSAAGREVELASAQRNIVLSGQVTSAAEDGCRAAIANGYLEQAATAKEKIMFEQENAAARSERTRKPAR